MGRLLIALLALSALFPGDGFSQTGTSQVTININLHRLQTIIVPDHFAMPEVTGEEVTREVRMTRPAVSAPNEYWPQKQAILPVGYKIKKAPQTKNYAYKRVEETLQNADLLYTISVR